MKQFPQSVSFHCSLSQVDLLLPMSLSDLLSTEVLCTASLAIAGILLLKRSTKQQIQDGKKQGGYGKIPIFQPKTTLRAMLADPRAMIAILKYKTGCGLPGVKKGVIPAPSNFAEGVTTKIMHEDIAFCGQMLDKVSRSFAAVIRQLPVTLALPVCVFYLVLRALDTVEDDMDLSKFKAALQAARSTTAAAKEEIDDNDARAFKNKCLLYFHTLLGDTGTADDGIKAGFYDSDTIFRTLADANVGEKDEATLFKKFDSIVRVYRNFSSDQRVIIADITRQMAGGMADYIDRDLSDKGTEDLRDYNQYCHYVAGLVGEGLSRLWATAIDSGLPKNTIDRLSAERGLTTLSSDMGLFLQKNKHHPRLS